MLSLILHAADSSRIAWKKIMENMKSELIKEDSERIVKKTVSDALNEKMHRAIIDKKLKEISSKIK